MRHQFRIRSDSAGLVTSQGREFAAQAKELGVSVELLNAANQPHGFFNSPPWIESTTLAADAWLVANGYLTGTASLKPSSDAKLTKQ